MKCPKCDKNDLEQLTPGVDTLYDDGDDVSPEQTFVCREYNCPNCGKLNMFFDYDRTEKEDNIVIHKNPFGEKK